MAAQNFEDGRVGIDGMFFRLLFIDLYKFMVRLIG